MSIYSRSIALALFLVLVTNVQASDWFGFDGNDEADPVIQMLSNSPSEISFSYTLPGLYYADINGERRLELYKQTVLLPKGYPEVPSHQELIALPVCSAVEVEIAQVEYEEFDQWPLLYPKPELMYDALGCHESYLKDTQAYGLNQWFPAEQVEIATPYLFRAQNVASLYINPIQYNPKNNVYRIIKSAIVTITPTSPGTTLNQKNAFGRVLEHSVINYDSPLSTVGDLPIQQGAIIQYSELDVNGNPLVGSPAQFAGTWYADYVILAGEDYFYDSGNENLPCSQLAGFAQHIRDTHGYDVLVVNLEHFADYNGFQYGHVYSFLRELYQSVGSRRIEDGGGFGNYEGFIRYISIIGDESDVPVTAFDLTTAYNSDTYYGNFSTGSSPVDSELPDVLVGRVHVQSPAELSAYTADIQLNAQTGIADQYWHSIRMVQSNEGIHNDNLGTSFCNWMPQVASSMLNSDYSSTIHSLDCDLTEDPDNIDLVWPAGVNLTRVSKAFIKDQIDNNFIGDGSLGASTLLLQASHNYVSTNSDSVLWGRGWVNYRMETGLAPASAYLSKICLSTSSAAAMISHQDGSYLDDIMADATGGGIVSLIGPASFVFGRNYRPIGISFQIAIDLYQNDAYSTRAGDLFLSTLLTTEIDENRNALALSGDPAFSPISTGLPGGGELVCKMTPGDGISYQDPTIPVTVTNTSYVDIYTSFDVNVYVRVYGQPNWTLAGSATLPGLYADKDDEVIVDLDLFTFLHTVYEVKAIVDEADVVAEMFDFNNESNVLVTRVSSSDPGYPRGLPTLPRGHVELAEVHPGYPGPELITSNICYNVKNKELIWENEGEANNGRPVVADLDYDGVKELITFSPDHYIKIWDAMTGDLIVEHHVDTVRVGPTPIKKIVIPEEDWMSCRILPVEAIAVLDGENYPAREARYSGMELLTLFHVHGTIRTSFFMLYTIDENWQLDVEWFELPDENRTVIHSLPAISYPDGAGNPKMTYPSMIYWGGNDTSEFTVRDLTTGNYIWSYPNPFPFANHEIQTSYGRQPTSMDQDEDGFETILTSFGQALYRVDFDYSIGYSLTHVGGSISSGNQESTIAAGPVADPVLNLAGLISFGTDLSEYDLLAYDVNLDMDYPQDFTSGGRMGQPLVGPEDGLGSYSFFVPNTESFVPTPGFSLKRTDLYHYVPTGAGTYSLSDTYKMPATIRKFIYITGQACGNITYPTWLRDVDGDGVDDYVSLVGGQEGGRVVDFVGVDVISGTDSGESDWPYPLGKEEIGYSRYSPLRPDAMLTTGQHTWWQNVQLDHDVTIPAGATVTINPKAEIVAAPGVQIDVYGELNILGEENAEIVFKAESGTWDGIRFRPGSTGEMHYFRIEDATTGLRMTNPDIPEPIQNFTLDHCTRGIYMNLTDDIQFENGLISSSSLYGVELYGVTTTKLVNVTINTGDVGIHLTQTSVKLDECTVENCKTGVYAVNSLKVEVENCWIQGNQNTGFYADNSIPISLSTSYNSNGKNGMVLLNSSDALLGKPYASEGNSFFGNGEKGLSVSSAELYLYQSQPYLEECHNDFIDEIEGYLVFDDSPGSPYHKALSNYWDGNSGVPMSQWFYPLGSVDYTNYDIRPNKPDLFPHTQDSVTTVATALDLENDGEYVAASDLYLELAINDQIAFALNGWVRCQLELSVTPADLILVLDAFSEYPYLSEVVFWNKIILQNRMLDFETTIQQLDTRISLAQTELDTSIHMLAQLDSYYEMYLSDPDIWDGKKSTAAKGGKKGPFETVDSEKKLLKRTKTGGADRPTNGEGFNLRKLGAHEYTVPENEADYSKKRLALLQKISDRFVESTDPNLLPQKFDLKPSYPNPFNPSTTIPFDVPKTSKVKLQVYNVLGQRVATLVDRPMQAGYHRVIWNSSATSNMSVASGVYFIRMEAPDFVKSQKIVLIK